MRILTAVTVLLLAMSNGMCAQEPDGTSESQNVSIHWKALLLQAFEFLAIENGFRVATQPETRATMGGPFFLGYARSIDNVHGWGDGDPFFVNYVGHPMQGAVSGYLFVQNDPRYIKAEFGRNRAYWKSRLRATAFSFAYSEEFEFGPISEATIGHTQQYYPQQGFVDQVITPTIGLAWMLAEDSLDRYVIARIERHTENPWLIMLARGGLNPSRSLANALRGDVPWHRDTRPGIFRDPNRLLASGSSLSHSTGAGDSTDPPASVNPQVEAASINRIPTIQVGMQYDFLEFPGGKGHGQACNGGDATLEYRFNSWLGLVANVGGCAVAYSAPDLTGDSTFYLAGPRLHLPRFGRWHPYVDLLAGGNKMTAETTYPNLEPPESVIDALGPYQTRSLYTNDNQTNSWALQFGGGAEYVMNSAFSFTALEVEDLHTWTRPLNGRDYRHALRVSTGLALRFGTW